MAWIAGAIALGTTLLSSAAQSKSASKASDAQTGASAEQIAFARESRDIELGRSEPYVQAGHSALSALMSLTGLSGPQGGSQAPQAQGSGQIINPNDELRGMRVPGSGSRGGSRRSLFTRAGGGPIQQDTYYNVNEMAPENRYVGGRVIRNRNPMTIDGETGYVEPNIEGRGLGGFLKKATGIWKDTSPLTGHGIFSSAKRQSSGSSAPQPTQQYGGSYNPQQYYGNNFSGNANTTAIDPATGYPYENPGGVEGGYNFKTDPGYQFRQSEGMRGLERGAAARGGLLSGGTARGAIRYNQNYASNEFSNVYNRIAGIAGVGQTANSQANQSSQFATGAINNATSDAGYARASGYMAQGNNYANMANQLGQVDWGNIFNRNNARPVGGPVDYQGYGGSQMGPPRG